MGFLRWSMRRFLTSSQIVSDASSAVEEFSPHLVIDIPRKSQGEDATPFTYSSPEGTWLGVFDGMGGAGAALYETPNGKQSGAYIASRTVAAAIYQWISESPNPQIPLRDQIFAVARDSLRLRAAELTVEPSRLKSRLIRSLPTTIAVARICATSEESKVAVEAFWTGDSRVYVQFPSGLMQLTKDHLSSPLDALENLSQDSPLSNCASADQAFFVESVPLVCGLPLIAIAATDGAFGYVKTPLLFEHLLLSTLCGSKSMSEWSRLLGERLSEITADDISMAIATVGVRSFNDLKKYFRMRAEFVAVEAGRLEEAQDRSNRATAAAERLRANVEDLVRSSWADYRGDYEHDFPSYRSSGDS